MPFEQTQGIGILIVWFAGMEKERGVERGRLLAPRMERSFLTVKRDWSSDKVVALGVR